MDVKQKSTPVAYHGRLIVRDGRIVGEKSKETAVLTGMSFFWSNASKHMYTAQMADRMIDEMGCEVLRCAYGISKEGVPFDESCEALIENVIDRCTERGIYVIVDWHAHSAQENTEAAVKYFDALSEKYGSTDNVIFEIYNEPAGVEWPVIKEYSQAVINCIRKHSKNLILVGNPQWSQRPDVAFSDPVEDENSAYTMHFYAGTHGDWLRGVSDDAIRNGAALFISEWGTCEATGNGDIAKESTRIWIDWMKKHELSSCNWAIGDKDETSSILMSDGSYSETGLYVKSLIEELKG